MVSKVAEQMLTIDSGPASDALGLCGLNGSTKELVGGTMPDSPP